MSRTEGRRRHGSNTREKAAAESTEGHSGEAHPVPHKEAEGAGPETTTSCQEAETLKGKKSGGEQMKEVHSAEELQTEEQSG